jgi:uncharacterized MAPEG superfamily protein
MPPKTRTEKSAKPDSQLLSTRKVTAIGVALGLVFIISLVYIYNHYLVQFVSQPHLHSLTDRLVFTLRYQLIGLFAVVWSLSQVSLTRAVTTAINPLSGHEAIIDKANRILTNSVEQFLLNFINQLIISTYLTEDKLKLIPLLSLLFITGRIAFWIGYQIAPKYRSFGFTVTAVPTFILFGFNVFFFFTTNTNYLLDGGKGFGRI